MGDAINAATQGRFLLPAGPLALLLADRWASSWPEGEMDPHRSWGGDTMVPFPKWM